MRIGSYLRMGAIASLGWIWLGGCQGPIDLDGGIVDALSAAKDSDGDGLTDEEETDVWGTDPDSADTDGDGVGDEDEVKTYGTSPTNPDTDGGGATDGDEVAAGTNPHWGGDDSTTPEPDLDTDGDGLSDFDEAQVYGTDPNLADTDGGGVGDGAEIAGGTNPHWGGDDGSDVGKDTDGDGLSDLAETQTYGTDPNNADTDGGGVNDGAEVANGLNPHWGGDDDPAAATDTDGDGLSDYLEGLYGTDPSDADSDDDGASDGAEVAVGADPLDATDGGNPPPPPTPPEPTEPPTPRPELDPDADDDGDGLTNGQEQGVYGTNATVADTDGGGVNDGDEITNGSNPFWAGDDIMGIPGQDSDSDGLTDQQEMQVYGTDPNDADTDDGGANDGKEIADHTNPFWSGDDIPPSP